MIETIAPYANLNIGIQNKEARQKNFEANKNKSLSVDSAILNNRQDSKHHSSLQNMYNSLIISDKQITASCINDVNYKNSFENQEKSKASYKNTLLSLGLGSIGISSFIWLLTLLAKNGAKNKAKLPLEKTLPEIGRNLAINDEKEFAIYMAIQDPNYKTMVAAGGVFSLSLIGLIGKNFIDGLKEIWIKKEEAKTEIQLQKKMIEVETNNFAGKLQIQRNMLSNYANRFENDLNNYVENESFVSFGKNEEKRNKKALKENIFYSLFGGLTLGSIFVLGYFSRKNLKIMDKYYKEFQANYKNKIKNNIKLSCNKLKENKNFLTPEYRSILESTKKSIVSLNVTKEEAIKMLEPFKETLKDGYSSFEEEVLTQVSKISEDAAEALGGKPSNKATFYTHIDDVRGYLYNCIVNDWNPTLTALFAGMLASTCFAYIASMAVEALKKIGVIKANAQTELDMQKNLVDVEMLNYKMKKNASIEPLVQEFDRRKNEHASKEELQVIAENILLEIKNGPPYIFN